MATSNVLLLKPVEDLGGEGDQVTVKAGYARNYLFPKKIASKIAMQQLRLYVTFTNLWTDTEVLGYGPELTPGDYPEPRTMLFGVNITF